MNDKSHVTTDFVVISYLLQKATDDDKGFTLLQLNKLLYICHGWILGFLDRPLIDNSDKQIQAWTYGPVVENVYNTLKDFGRTPITFEKFCDHMSVVVKTDYRLYFPYMFDQLEKKHPDVYEILNWVYKHYNNFTAGQLINLTHREGTPWKQVVGRDWIIYGKHIPDDLIKDYYKNEVSELIDEEE